MRVVLSADDLGLNAHVNGRIAAALDDAIVSSASLIVTMPGTAEALTLARARPQASFGMHLCFVEGRALSGPLPYLTDATGCFRPNWRQRGAALAGLLSVDAIAREADAQLSVAAEAGLAIDYVDSHGHIHKLAPFREALARVLPRFGVSRVRNVQTLYLRPRPLSPTFLVRSHLRDRIARCFRTTDEFYMPTSAGDRDWAEPLLHRLDGSDRTVEIGIHPGLAGDEDREEQDARRFAALAADGGHVLVPWRSV